MMIATGRMKTPTCPARLHCPPSFPGIRWWCTSCIVHGFSGPHPPGGFRTPTCPACLHCPPSSTVTHQCAHIALSTGFPVRTRGCFDARLCCFQNLRFWPGGTVKFVQFIHKLNDHKGVRFPLPKQICKSGRHIRLSTHHPTPTDPVTPVRSWWG